MARPLTFIGLALKETKAPFTEMLNGESAKATAGKRITPRTSAAAKNSRLKAHSIALVFKPPSHGFPPALIKPEIFHRR
jgi:hypothetical protein